MAIKAILFDVDGVLTDGKITYDGNGNELKSFNVKDGQLIKFMQQQGFIFGAISGRSSAALEKRAQELGLDFFRQGSRRKQDEYSEFKKAFKVTNEQVAYIGDDVIDWGILRQVALPVAPSDAVFFIKKCCKLITSAKGGEGVLREVIEHIITEQNLQQELENYYSG